MVKTVPPISFATAYPIMQNSRVLKCDFAKLIGNICYCEFYKKICYNCPICPMKEKLKISPDELRQRLSYWETIVPFGIYNGYTLRELRHDKLTFLREDLIRRDYLYNRLYESLKHLSFEIVNLYFSLNPVEIKEKMS